MAPEPWAYNGQSTTGPRGTSSRHSKSGRFKKTRIPWRAVLTTLAGALVASSSLLAVGRVEGTLVAGGGMQVRDANMESPPAGLHSRHQRPFQVDVFGHSDGVAASYAHDDHGASPRGPASQLGEPSTTNPLDVLTSSPNHTILVRLLQRTRLIPTLIRLIEFDDGSGLTILAPTDEALRRESSASAQPSGGHAEALTQGSIWYRAMREFGLEETEAGDEHSKSHHFTQAGSSDNVQAELRQHLLHHILNYTLPYETFCNLSSTIPRSDSKRVAPKDSVAVPLRWPDMHSTLHFPSRKALHEPTHPGPIPQPPEGPRHPGAEDRGGLLGGEGQKLRTVWRWDDQADDASAMQQPRANLLAKKKPEPEARGSLWFDVDFLGRGGVQSIAQHHTNRGAVISINGTIALPPTLEEVIRTHESLSLLSSLIEEPMLHTLSLTAHSTLFLPSSASLVNNLDTLQRSYLLRNVSKEEQREAWKVVEWDRTKMVGWHISGRGLKDENGEWGVIGYADRLRDAVDDEGQGQLTTILGGPIRFAIEDADRKEDSKRPALSIDGAQIIEEDILTENGVVHIVDGVLLPSAQALELDVEKTLLALNASRFVSMMKKAGLESYLLTQLDDPSDDTSDDSDAASKTWTFVVPTDEVLESWFKENPEYGRWWQDLEQIDGATPLTGNAYIAEDQEKGRQKLKDLLKYHIVPGLMRPDNLTDGGLVATELRDWRLKEGRQRIMTTVADPVEKTRKQPPQGNGDVAFGDANVIASPVNVGGDNSTKAIIYLVSQLLTPPDDPIQTAVTESLSLSTFVAAVFSAELDKPMKKAPGVTYLIPNNDAFASMGLVMPYLLLPTKESRDELRSLVEYHAIDQIVYVEDFKSSERRYPTLEGSDIWAGRSANGSVEVRRAPPPDEDGKEPYDLVQGSPAHLRSKDLLTSTGVIHEIDRVELPPDMNLTPEKLLKGAKCDRFRDLVVRAGYGFLLNGTTPSASMLAALDAEDDLEDEGVSTKTKKQKREKRAKKDHKRRHRLFEDPSQSYILLAPTDAAFTQVNLSYYLNNKQELKKLVQLHILPSPPLDDVENLRTAETTLGAGQLQLPLGLRDGFSLPSLLDKALGGDSSYGKVAFRNLGGASGPTHRRWRPGWSPRSKAPTTQKGDEDEEDLGWMIGILGSRGGAAEPLGDEADLSAFREDGDDDDDKDPAPRHRPRRNSHAARLLNFGRESLASVPPKEASLPISSSLGKRDQNAFSADARPPRSLGGVLTLDQVLIPYEPDWFHAWGWIVLTALAALLAVILAGAALHSCWRGGGGGRVCGAGGEGGGWFWGRNKTGDMGEALEGEEE